jgi:hypothetical protein
MQKTQPTSALSPDEFFGLVGADLCRRQIFAAVAERWTEEPGVRSLAEIKTILDAHAPSCQSVGEIANYAEDLLHNDRQFGDTEKLSGSSSESTDEMLDDRYYIGLAKDPRDVAEHRLAVCRNQCEAHYTEEDSPAIDRCKKCHSCPGTAGILFVTRLTGEQSPVAGCLWAKEESVAS